MAAAKLFYGKILPALGFPHAVIEASWATTYYTVDPGPNEFFGFTEDPDHRPNETRIAFWAETRAEVDRIAQRIKEAGCRNPEGPELCLEYTPGYYAFFFEDPDGNKLEVCCRERDPVAD